MWVKGRFCCRYDGEHSQTHLEGLRLNQASGMDQAIRQEVEGKSRKRSKKPEAQESTQEPGETKRVHWQNGRVI